MRAEASSPEFFNSVFRKNFRCRLVFFQYNAQTKFVNETSELASIDFEPKLVAGDSKEWQTVELPKRFVNPRGNFSFGSGMGVSIRVERSTGGALAIAKSDSAFLRVADVKLKFLGKEVNEKVTV